MAAQQTGAFPQGDNLQKDYSTNLEVGVSDMGLDCQIRRIQVIQKRVARLNTACKWLVRNTTLHSDLIVITVLDDMIRHSSRCYKRLQNSPTNETQQTTTEESHSAILLRRVSRRCHTPGVRVSRRYL